MDRTGLLVWLLVVERVALRLLKNSPALIWSRALLGDSGTGDRIWPGMLMNNVVAKDIVSILHAMQSRNGELGGGGGKYRTTT